jgi:choice-of-anchor C domain-containing protein
MKKLRLLTLSGCAALAASAFAMSSAASAATIVNGSFELGTAPGGYATTWAGSSALTGWTVGGASVDYIGNYWQAADGSRSIDLAGFGIGSISQTIETIVGQAYSITFSVAANLDGGSTIRNGFIDVGGEQSLISFDSTGKTRADMGWEVRTFEFVALDALTTLTFSADAVTSANNFGLALDNVSISAIDAVPEPGAWAMLLFGFGSLGYVMRNRRNPIVSFA